MKEIDLHIHSFSACVRGDGSLDPLRGVCKCGVYSESDSSSFTRRMVTKDYVMRILNYYRP